MRNGVGALFVCLTLIGSLAAQTPLGTAFTYQGRLTEDGAPANGVYDLELRLFDAGVGGTQVGTTIVRENVGVAGGVFSVSLDFGAAPFTGSARWLGVGVRPGPSTGSFTALSPLQELTPAPNAVFASTAGAVNWSNVTNKPAGFADNVDNVGVNSVAAGSGLTLVGTTLGTDSASIARKDGAANQAFDADTLFLDYTADRVGVGTASPGTTLDVDGITRSAGFSYTAPKTSAYRVAGVNFVPDQGAVTVEYNSAGYLYFTGTTVAAQLYAAVHIPDGATITGGKCDTYDNDSANNFTSRELYVFRRPSGGSGMTVSMTFWGATAGASTLITTLNTAAINEVVDATDSDYYMLFFASVNAGSANLRFFGCVLNYTLPGPAY